MANDIFLSFALVNKSVYKHPFWFLPVAMAKFKEPASVTEMQKGFLLDLDVTLRASFEH